MFMTQCWKVQYLLAGATEEENYLGLPQWLSGKESACSAGDAGLIPGSGRFPGEGKATLSSILAWEILWTESAGGLQSMGSQKSQTT